MSDSDTPIRRILLPVDISQDSLSALAAAFDLAAAVGAEVCGLFIEDSELLAASALPFTREIGSHSGIATKIGAADIQHRFRFIADKARQSVTAIGMERKVSSSFHVGRGKVTEQILTAAGQADVVALGKTGWSNRPGRTPGTTCLEVLAGSRVPVLVVERGTILGPPIIAVNDGTAGGQRALEVARHLQQKLRWEMAIVAARGLTDADLVTKTIRHFRSQLLVLPASFPLSEHAPNLKCPVLFVPSFAVVHKVLDLQQKEDGGDL
jgi:nucleotide-binding universal stress UspA family protein